MGRLSFQLLFQEYATKHQPWLVKFLQRLAAKEVLANRPERFLRKESAGDR
jgi:hypothetical protein